MQRFKIYFQNCILKGQYIYNVFGENAIYNMFGEKELYT